MSQTIPRGGPRSQIAIPAQGMIEFRDALTELLDEFGTDDQGEEGKTAVCTVLCSSAASRMCTRVTYQTNFLVCHTNSNTGQKLNVYYFCTVVTYQTSLSH